jgi:hypothetical protein
VKIKCVKCTGPEPDTDQYGEEIPCWTVELCGEDGEPISPQEVTHFHKYGAAVDFAKYFAKQYRAELIMEAVPE